MTVLLNSCATTGRHDTTNVREALDGAAVKLQRAPPPKIERISHDTYIYRCQNLRADETAEALRLLLEQNTDVEYVIVPHEETNSLIIKVLPRDRNDPTRRPGVRTPRSRR